MSVRVLPLLALSSAASLVLPHTRLAVADGVPGGTPAKVVHQSALDWAAAARTGRADMLVLGDSVVWYGGNGWDAGFNKAANDRFGLAGTGLNSGAFVGQGEGFESYGIQNGPWSTDPATVPASRAGYTWFNPVSAGASPASGQGWGVFGSTLPANAAYDMHLYTASPAGGGSVSAIRRLGVPSYPVLATTPAVNTQTPATGLQHTVLPFPSNSLDAGTPQEFFLSNTTNTSVLYSRLLRPDATGVTVTTWGYGGHSARAFLADQYTPAGGMTREGRAAWLTAMSDGGSGKLNVVIAEGFNDRADTAVSADGTNASNTPAGFAANVSSIVAAVRSDWAAAGKNPSDLTFTLLGTYGDRFNSGPTGILRDYAAAEAGLAAADPQVNFVDLYQFVPSFDESERLGYIVDDVHLTRDGALAYSAAAFDAMTTVPEPATSAVAAVAAVGLLVRRRRR